MTYGGGRGDGGGGAKGCDAAAGRLIIERADTTEAATAPATEPPSSESDGWCKLHRPVSVPASPHAPGSHAPGSKAPVPAPTPAGEFAATKSRSIRTATSPW